MRSLLHCKISKEVQERINLFRTVREIPFYVSVGKEQDFSCSTKAYVLEKLLKLGSRRRICEFRWEDMNLPEWVLKYYHEDPGYHYYLEVFIPETLKWIIVDSTWDSGLKSIFEVTEWDGLSNTKIAVPVKKILSLTKSQSLIQKFHEPKEIKKYLLMNREFLIALNDYLKRLRDNFT